MKEICISKDGSGQRIDKYLLKYFNKASKSFIYKMLRKKRIKLNNLRAEGNEMLTEGDSIQMFLADETMDSFMEEKTVSRVKCTFGIVYEDENILVVSKPAGLLSHAEKKEDTNTLIDQILYYLNEKGEYIPEKDSTFTPALCNRLDRNTSGVVISGKNANAVRQINDAIKNKSIRKFYHTIVCGQIKAGGRLENMYSKDKDKNKATFSDEGKKIITEYKPIKYTGKYTLLEIQLITGKSHQIRLHMQSIGSPIIGDIKYGNMDENKKFAKLGIRRQMLHAYRIEWSGMQKELNYLNGMIMTADIPDDFRKAETEIFGRVFE
ncbi:MAG: RluA family pseudouridine synthase [Candidatus Metalachnospira sp.]|nr:RluA family pseudouridine synthase [Candidatus Metalachnospira sp.]